MGGVYWIHRVRMSVRPSVCPSVRPSVCRYSVFLCKFYTVIYHTKILWFCANCIYIQLHYIHCCCYFVYNLWNRNQGIFIIITLYCIEATILNSRWRPPCCFLSYLLYWPPYSAYNTIMHITWPCLYIVYCIDVYYTYKINCNMFVLNRWWLHWNQCPLSPVLTLHQVHFIKNSKVKISLY